jgi:hypothetical protein
MTNMGKGFAAFVAVMVVILFVVLVLPYFA